MNALLRALLVAALSALPVTAAYAVPLIKEVHLVGKVISVVSPNGVLASYGVKKGAVVEVTYQVDLNAPPQSQSGPPDNITHYQGAITWMLIEVGDWLAMRVPAPSGQLELNLASIADDSGADADVDLLSLTAPGTDNDLILSQGAGVTMGLSFSDPFGYAGTDQTLDQDPTRYLVGTGSVYGLGGHVVFTIDAGKSGGSSGPNADPSATCAKSQLAAAGKLCQSQLKCHAKYSKAPTKDPLGEKRDECLDKAEDAFAKAYSNAAAKAASKGLACGTDDSASEQHESISEETDDIVEQVDMVSPVHPPLSGAWLDGAAAACNSALGAEAGHAGKPNPKNLGKAREKARDKLRSAAQKAVLNAGRKGVVFDPPADVDGFVASVESAIQAVLEDVGGH
jgi:hypothetical protein